MLGKLVVLYGHSAFTQDVISGFRGSVGNLLAKKITREEAIFYITRRFLELVETNESSN
jgi:hypothetical protein